MCGDFVGGYCKYQAELETTPIHCSRFEHLLVAVTLPAQMAEALMTGLMIEQQRRGCAVAAIEEELT
jgi:hypothetical protein